MAGGSSKSKKGHGPHHGLALTLCSVLVIAGVLFLQMAARKLKRWSEGQKHASDVLEASERELTVLGLIAFGLFVLEAFKGGKGEWYGIFHEVHFALFTIAIVYMSVNAFLYFLSRRFAMRWRGFEYSDKADHRGIIKRLHNLRKRLSIRPLDHHLFFGSFWLRGLCRHPLAWLEYQRYLEHITFHEIRRDFLRSQHLPHDFNFTVYLEACMQHVCLEFTEIRDSVWVLGILGLVLHQFAATLASRPTVASVLVGLSIGIIVLILTVFLKVKWIYWYVLHSEMLYSPGTDMNGSEEALLDSSGTRAVSSRNYRRNESSGVQRSLFWFDNPGLVVTMLEACLFAVSGNAAILLFRIERLSQRQELAAPAAALLAAVAALFILLPRIIPRFTLITHIGEMTDPRRLAQAVTKQQQRGRLGYEKAMSLRSRNAAALQAMDTSNTQSENAGIHPEHPHCLHWIFSSIWHQVVEAPGLSAISAVLVVAYCFAVVVTLDEAGARAVIGHGGVVIVRSVEVGLSGIFLIEAGLRFAYAPRMLDRKLDLILVATCATCDIISFALFLTTTEESVRKLVVVLHAVSALVVLRVVNTAWHEELREVRLEHIRLDLEKTAELEKPIHLSQRHTGASSSRGSALPLKRSHNSPSIAQGQLDSAHASMVMTSTMSASGRKRRATQVFGPNNTARSLFLAASSSSNILALADGDDEEKEAAPQISSTRMRKRRPSETPAWLTFYEPPGSAVVKSDERHPTIKAAEVRVHDLIVAVLDEIARDPDAYTQSVDTDDADLLARKALELSLQRHDAYKAAAHELAARSAVSFAATPAKSGRSRSYIEGASNNSLRDLSPLLDEESVSGTAINAFESAASLRNDIESNASNPRLNESDNSTNQLQVGSSSLGPPPPPPSSLTSRVTSTQVEELEDVLYFNHVVLHTLVTVAKGKRNRKLFGAAVVDDIWQTLAQPVIQRAASISGHRDNAVSRKSSLRRESSVRELADSSLVWLRCRLILTRDALYYYRTGSHISALAHGIIQHLNADTAEPTTLALDTPDCYRPDGKLHINTILSISTKAPNGLICTTTSSSFYFDFDHPDHPNIWKAAIEDAIDREDDDDPLHPLGDDALSLASVDSFLRLDIQDLHEYDEDEEVSESTEMHADSSPRT